MFDFFFALFGGLGYAAKSSYNKSKSKSVENRRRGYEITEMAIRTYDTPKTLADGWVMLNEIEDDLVALFGKDWVQIFKHQYGYENPKRKIGSVFNGSWGVWAIAYNIWLSKHGYISDVEYHIVSPEHLGEIILSKEEQHKYPFLAGKINGHHTLVKMFQLMERNMQQHFPDHNFGLWLYYSELATQTSASNPWTIKWNYWFDSTGIKPVKKPW